jgi:hypothetical protein
MGADQGNIMGFKHTCTNVKKCKEGSLKQSQVKNTLGIVVTNFGYKSSSNKCGQNFCPQYTIIKDLKLTYQKWACIFHLELKAKNLMMKEMIESQIIHLILEDPRNMDKMILNWTCEMALEIYFQISSSNKNLYVGIMNPQSCKIHNLAK